MLVMQQKEGNGSGLLYDPFDDPTVDSFWTFAGLDTHTVGVVSGAVQFDLAVGAGTNNPRYIATKRPQGDFDFRIKVDTNNANTVDANAWLQCGLQVTIGAFNYNVRAFDEDNSGYSNYVGSWTNNGPEYTNWLFDGPLPARTVELRIGRVGTTLSGYYRDYSLGEGAAWTFGNSLTVPSTPVVDLRFFTYSDIPLTQTQQYRVLDVRLEYPPGELI